jgi:hypothetical protein
MRVWHEKSQLMLMMSLSNGTCCGEMNIREFKSNFYLCYILPYVISILKWGIKHLGIKGEYFKVYEILFKFSQ